jgi:hypothetical protein
MYTTTTIKSIYYTKDEFQLFDRKNRVTRGRGKEFRRRRRINKT